MSKFIHEHKEDIESLKKGDDYPLRQSLSREIEEIINQSEKGEIAIADFTIELRIILDKGAYLANKYFPKN